MTLMRIFFLSLMVSHLSLNVFAINCYICNNCVKFELSQSRQCDVASTYCMKLDINSGQVQRRCASYDLCNNPSKNIKTKHKKVSCCETDNCNSGPSIESSLLPLWIVAYLTFSFAINIIGY